MLGAVIFILAPLALAAVLLWRYPATRRLKPAALLTYPLVMGAVLYGALRLVAWIAVARVPWSKLLIALWFTITCRLAWSIWCRSVGRLGQARVRLARLHRRHGRPTAGPVRLIPLGRAMLTALLFVPVFVTFVATHRLKLTDGQDPGSVFSLDFESVRFATADGLTLDGWFIPEQGARRTIVICHGAGANKGNFVWFVGPLRGHGYNVLMFDFRAHGASDGRVATYGIREQEDVLAAVAWLKRERPAESELIVGLGSSQGALALALAAARDRRIDAVVLDSPFTGPRDLMRDNAAALPIIGPLLADWCLALASAQTATDFFSPSAEQAVAALGNRPVFVVHGSDDFIMPAAHSVRLHAAAAGPRELWMGPGPHSNIITSVPDEYARRLFTFLDAHLGTAAASRP